MTLPEKFEGQLEFEFVDQHLEYQALFGPYAEVVEGDDEAEVYLHRFITSKGISLWDVNTPWQLKYDALGTNEARAYAVYDIERKRILSNLAQYGNGWDNGRM